MEKKYKKEILENHRSSKVEDLKTQSASLKEELRALQFKLKSGQTDQASNVRKIRKDIARIETVLTEKQGM